jgi:hypothetical protein
MHSYPSFSLSPSPVLPRTLPTLYPPHKQWLTAVVEVPVDVVLVVVFVSVFVLVSIFPSVVAVLVLVLVLVLSSSY